MRQGILTILTLFVFTACTQTNERDELSEVVSLMQGHFSSKLQSEQDSAFFDINLVMYPIWEENTEAKWLYVEQAVSSKLEKPYRQRVYKLSKTEDGMIESAVYELPQPSRFIHAWDTPVIFTTISPDSLVTREGCSVFLKKQKDGSYAGATNERDCKSSLYGASYATSEVEVSEAKITSWDRGWNDAGEQIWGAEKGAYVFDKYEVEEEVASVE
ncbi:chromophore lyase CpcT/CpeT [Sediminitomix flava]|uniref:CpeT/CpcT family protein DUF1001 n=1 Tax=Sediminitomix flava TaxID=379075 RepID=A0A315ZHP1_SEDFL|nr:chromophore lyase CpcT/CpeT [Sediminitomix flava]PWJ44224.1 CpeT/CpcT family protein DUF1001 [Sediminitomix flava]